jgi:hypothetical protein
LVEIHELRRLTLLSDTVWGTDPSSYSYGYDADDRRTATQFASPGTTAPTTPTATAR